MSARIQEKRGERGSTLIVVLWAVMLLAFAVAIAAERVSLMLGDSSIRAKRFQAELLADSALASSDAILKEERRRFLESTLPSEGRSKTLDFSKILGVWRSRPATLGEGSYWLEVRDEQSRIHWRKTPPGVWRNLLELNGVPREKVDAWMDAVADWEDADDARALNGAETADYRALPEGHRRAKNSPITDLGEIPWVMGAPDLLGLRVPADLSRRTVPLMELTTLYGDGKINLNTAPPVLIAAALGLDLETAEQMVRTRAGPDGLEGTADDVPMERITPSAGGIRSREVGENATGGGPVPGSTTTSSGMFRLRGVGWYQGQQVVREALARRAGAEGFQLLESPRTIEARTVVTPPAAQSP